MHFLICVLLISANRHTLVSMRMLKPPVSRQPAFLPGFILHKTGVGPTTKEMEDEEAAQEKTDQRDLLVATNLARKLGATLDAMEASLKDQKGIVFTTKLSFLFHSYIFTSKGLLRLTNLP